MSTALASLASYHYLAVETYRRSGVGVVTPVWFVTREDVLYFSAPAHTGKVKRLRHTARARVAPCDQRGALLGAWTTVIIQPVEGSEAEDADRLLQRRYGWQRRLLDIFGWLRRWRYVIYAIRPAED